MKILIIEDDHDLSLAISEYLELHNIDCDFAYNGETGIQLASQQTFDCVILDNMLPKTQGMAVCRELREQGIDTPVLMLTACGADTDQLEGFRAGVDDYVVKPCTMPLLLARRCLFITCVCLNMPITAYCAPTTSPMRTVSVTAG